MQAAGIAVENGSFSNATVAIAMPDGFAPEYMGLYDIYVNLAVPTYTSGASVTIGNVYLYGRCGGYKRLPGLFSPFVLRARYLGDPERWSFVSMRRGTWMRCA